MQLLKITNLDPNGTVARAGLAIGDYIKAVDGEPVTSVSQLGDLVLPNLRNMRTRSFELTLLRSGEQRIVKLARGEHGVSGALTEFDARAANQERITALRIGQADTISAFLEEFKLGTVLVNITEPLQFVECLLAGVASDHLTLAVGNSISLVPYTSLLSLNRPSPADLLQLVIRHQVIYKGSVGIGFQFPT